MGSNGRVSLTFLFLMSPDINANLAQEYGSQKQLNTSTRFLGLPGRGVVSRLGVQGRLKNRVEGRGRGEMARGGGSGPRSGADLETPKTTLPARESYRQSMPTLAAGVLLLDGQHIRDSKKPSSKKMTKKWHHKTLIRMCIYIYIYSCVITSKHCRSWTPRFLYHASPWQNHNRLQMTKRFPNLYPFTRLCICSPYLVLFLACLRVHIERSSIQNRCIYLPTASP